MPELSDRRPASGGGPPAPTGAPRWRALVVGPGGIPPEQVRPVGPDAPWLVPFHPGPPTDICSAWPTSAAGPGQAGPIDPWAPGPSAPPPARARRILGWVLLGVVAVLLMALAIS